MFRVIQLNMSFCDISEEFTTRDTVSFLQNRLCVLQ